MLFNTAKNPFLDRFAQQGQQSDGKLLPKLVWIINFRLTSKKIEKPRSCVHPLPESHHWGDNDVISTSETIVAGHSTRFCGVPFQPLRTETFIVGGPPTICTVLVGLSWPPQRKKDNVQFWSGTFNISQAAQRRRGRSARHDRSSCFVSWNPFKLDSSIRLTGSYKGLPISFSLLSSSRLL